jgi:hypothetical protein
MPIVPRPLVCFEEWDEPMIPGIASVSELIAAAGGIFADRAAGKSAKERIVTAAEIIARRPTSSSARGAARSFGPRRSLPDPVSNTYRPSETVRYCARYRGPTHSGARSSTLASPRISKPKHVPFFQDLRPAASPSVSSQGRPSAPFRLCAV